MPFLRFHPQNGTFLELLPSDSGTAIQEPKWRPTASPGKGVTFRDSLARASSCRPYRPNFRPISHGIPLHASGSRRHGRACPVWTPLTHGWQSSGPIFGHALCTRGPMTNAICVRFRLAHAYALLTARRIPDAYTHIGRRLERPRIAS